MLPVLFAIGSFKVYTFGLFLFVALFFGLYWWWKLGRDEHMEETSLFDTYFISLIVFVVVARAVYVLLHLSEFENIYRILGILSFPGMSYLGGALGATLSVVAFAYAREWEIWKILDNLATSLGIVFLIASVGWVLNGSLVGIWMSGIQVAWAIGYFLIITRVRKNFRFYAWYRNEKTVAQEGLPTLIATLMAGVLYTIRGFLDHSFQLGLVSYYTFGGVMVVLISIVLIYLKSGREFFKKK